MALTGELSDLSLAELIEFFCNQRKTGRLKVVYANGHGYFYLQSGSVVHARIGDLRGIEAVYYALTQKNASFTFSPAVEAPEHTINQPWTSVVLEGLRRMDEGISPPNPSMENGAEPVEEIEVEEIKIAPLEVKPARVEVTSEPPAPKPAPSKPKPAKAPEVAALPFLSQVESSSRFSNGRWKVGAAFAAVLLIAGVGVPWGWYARSKTKAVNDPKPVVAAEAPVVNSAPAPIDSPAATDSGTAAPATNSDAEDQARRQREARLREEAKKKAAESSTALTAAAKPQPASATGSKKVTVQVTYDENGRVTQASGGDATALRIARQKRFPAGKPGSATITIPIN
jgi:hypothetical protein